MRIFVKNILRYGTREANFITEISENIKRTW